MILGCLIEVIKCRGKKAKHDRFTYKNIEFLLEKIHCHIKYKQQNQETTQQI
jgi:hypothetical protein